MRLQMAYLEVESIRLKLKNDSTGSLKDCMEEAVAYCVANQMNVVFKYQGYDYSVQYDAVMECVVSTA